MSYEDAFKAVQITSIANAVQQLDAEYAEYCKEPSAEIRWRMEAHAERICEMVKHLGGKCAANPFYHDVQHKEIPFPAKAWGDRTMSVKPWPTAAEGAAVEIDGVQYTVVVNRVWGGNGGRYVYVFSIYAIIPA